MDDPRMSLHRKRYATDRPVLFCLACGSTRVDVLTIATLRCGDCDNEMPFDGEKFSVRRYDGWMGEDDVIDGLRRTPGPLVEGA